MIASSSATLGARLHLEPLHLIRLAFVLSGVAGLMLEVIWTRLLTLAFGASAPAISTVLAVYMGGMALGALAVQRYPRLSDKPLRRYAQIEFFIAACALLLPLGIELLAPLHRALESFLPENSGLLPLLSLRALVLGLVLLPPTAAMGATLPLLAQALRGPDAARQTGSLYALNLLGAMGGAALSGFVLLPLWGLRLSNGVAASLDVLAAGLALWASHRLGEDLGEPLQLLPCPKLRGAELTVVVAVGLSGALAMQLQVLWSRALSVVLGSSVYAFSMILTVTLLGMSIGGRWVATRRHRGQPRVALRRLAWLFVVAAAGVLLGHSVIDRLPLVIRDAARTRFLSAPFLFAIEIGIIAAIVAVPAAALGGALPAALQVAQHRLRQHAAAFVGRAYAVNTAGAIVGSIVGGFGVLPLAGVDDGLRGSALAYALLGAAVLGMATPRRQGRWRWLPALGVVAIASALSLGLPRFAVMQWSAGFFRVYLPRTISDDNPGNDRLIFHHDGVTATVTVEDNFGSTALKINGKVDASSKGDMPTQILSGLLPFTFTDEVKRVAIIGYGSGVTTGAVLSTTVQRVDLIELEVEVLRAGQLFAHVNKQPWKDPRAHFIVDDGRNFMRRPGDRYQVIISEPSNPWMTGAASLFTQEFWRVARARLTPGGVFLQWIQLYELDEDRIRSLMATFASVFDHVLLMAAHPGSSDSFIIGSNQPLRIDLDRVRELMAHPKSAAMLRRADLLHAIELVGLILLDDARVRAFADGAVINTDDNAYVEFRAPLDLIATATREVRLPGLGAWLGHRDALLAQVLKGTLTRNTDPCASAVEVAQALLRRGALDDAETFLRKAPAQCAHRPEHRLAAARLHLIVEKLVEEDNEAVVDPWAVKEGDLRYLRVIGAMIDGSDTVALSDLEAFAELDSASEAWMFLWAYLCGRNDRHADAEQLYRRLLGSPAYLAHMPAVYYYAARNAFLRNHYRLAARAMAAFVDALLVRQGRGFLLGANVKPAAGASRTVSPLPQDPP